MNKRKEGDKQPKKVMITRNALNRGHLEDIDASNQKRAFSKMQAYLSIISSILALLSLVTYIVGFFLFHNSLLLFSVPSIVTFLPLWYILQYYFSSKDGKKELVQKQEIEETLLKVKKQQLEIQEKELELMEKRVETALEMVAKIESIKEKNTGKDDIIEELQFFALRLINNDHF